MVQIYTSVSEHIEEELKQLAEKTGKTFSKIVSEMIELGLKINKMQGENKQDFSAAKKQELNEKHTEYLLNILGISRDILSCVYNKNVVRHKQADIENELKSITQTVCQSKMKMSYS